MSPAPPPPVSPVRPTPQLASRLPRDPAAWLSVFCGGALGTLARAAAEGTFGSAGAASSDVWPWPTWVVNVSGAFVLGALLELLAAGGPDRGRRRLVRLALGTGALGGFTTYSTFAVETVRLAGERPLLAAGYVAASLAAGLVSAGLGVAAARRGLRLRRRA